MRKILWFVLFLLVLFVGDRLAGYFLQKQVNDSQFRYSRLYRGAAAADILLIGNSRGLTFYQPYIEEKTGLKTFNTSYNGLPMDATQCLVLDYLDRYPAPKTVLIDITAADRENDELLTGFLTYAQYSPRLNALIKRKQRKFWGGAQLSWLTRFNNEIFQRALFHKNKTDEDWMLDRQINSQLIATVAENSYPLEVHPYLINELKALVAAAQKKGSAVHLIIGPYFPNFKVENLDALKNAAETATGLEVHDFRDVLTDPALFGDYMHPNKNGAMALIDIMMEKGLFVH